MNYPLTLSFKLFSSGRNIRGIDSLGQTVLRVHQKAFALKEKVDVTMNSDHKHSEYKIKADRILDYSAEHYISDDSGKPLGKVRRQGMKSRWVGIYYTLRHIFSQDRWDLEKLRSQWKITYFIEDASGNEIGRITEWEPLLKLIGTFLEEVILIRPFLNPMYEVVFQDHVIFQVKKRPAFLRRIFTVDTLEDIPEELEGLLLNGLFMMLLLERYFGI
jgi:uncharacterized protein YxjI